jgi:hypothetical protein
VSGGARLAQAADMAELKSQPSKERFMLGKYLVPPLSAIFLFFTAVSSSAADDNDIVGPPGFDE